MLKKFHDVHYDPTLVTRPDELIEQVRDADAIIVRNLIQVRGALLDAMTKCRVVGRLGVGLDNIDVLTCRERGIAVVPAIGANARSVAEYVITSALMLRRRSYLSTAEVAAGQWPKAEMVKGRELCGATLGVIGFGSIGQSVARLARLLDMQVVAHDSMIKEGQASQFDPPVNLMSIDAVLANSDVVTLHVPHTGATHGMINSAAIAKMRPGSVLINSARGGVVDEQAVVDALRGGSLAGAALDVFSEEPLASGSCFENPPPNLILTPHIAGVTQDSEQRVCELVANKVIELLR